jgi:hypothetical protein
LLWDLCCHQKRKIECIEALIWVWVIDEQKYFV